MLRWLFAGVCLFFSVRCTVLCKNCDLSIVVVVVVVVVLVAVVAIGVIVAL